MTKLQRINTNSAVPFSSTEQNTVLVVSHYSQKCYIQMHQAARSDKPTVLPSTEYFPQELIETTTELKESENVPLSLLDVSNC